MVQLLSPKCHTSDDVRFPATGRRVGDVKKRDADRLQRIKDAFPALFIVVFNSCEVVDFYHKDIGFKTFCKFYDAPPQNLLPRAGFYGGMTCTFRDQMSAAEDGKIVYIGLVVIITFRLEHIQYLCRAQIAFRWTRVAKRSVSTPFTN